MNYTDVLLQFPDEQTAISVGISMGATAPDGSETVPMLNTPLGELNFYIIGIHYFEEGNEEHTDWIAADGWWVMIRATENYPVPESILGFIVEPNPADPTIPNFVWAGDPTPSPIEYPPVLSLGDSPLMVGDGVISNE